jgi:ankyrin repeat protein
MSDIDKFFINPLNSMLLSDASTPINITDILEIDDNNVYTINNLQAKLSFLIPQKLLGKKSEWVVGEISTQYCSADSQQLIVAIGNSYFGVIDKQNLHTNKNKMNITFDNNTPVQLQHITPELITKNNLQKTSYRALIINALQNTNNAAKILNFFNNVEIKNILQQDTEFSEYLSTIISMKIAENPELKENLADLICNEIIVASDNNTNILSCYFSYIIFMKSTLLEPILHKLLDNKIDITDILVELEISQIVNLSEKDSLKQLCDRALYITANIDETKQKLMYNLAIMHYKLMKYGHSHVIPIIISTNIINPILGNRATVDNENELLICARYRNAESIKIIMQENFQRSEQDKLNINQQNNDGDTALMISSRNGDAATLTEILKDENIAVNMQNQNGYTALMIVADKGNAECIKILLAHKVDVNSKKKSGCTALMLAAVKGYIECVKMLLEHKADVDAEKDGCTALIFATQNNHTECVKILLEYDANVNLKAKQFHETALMLAAAKGHIECVKILLEHKADVDAEKDGCTALIFAAQNNHTECVKILLEYDADVNLKTKQFHNTALIVATQKGNLECMKLLLKHHADINFKNTFGDTALDIAKNNYDKECINYLKKYSSTKCSIM